MVIVRRGTAEKWWGAAEVWGPSAGNYYYDPMAYNYVDFRSPVAVQSIFVVLPLDVRWMQNGFHGVISFSNAVSGSAVHIRTAFGQDVITTGSAAGGRALGQLQAASLFLLDRNGGSFSEGLWRVDIRTIGPS